MILFPNCKINLGLHILQKRNDGYHDLETVFFPVPVTDVLEIIENKEAGTPPLQFTSSGININGHPAQNLCVKAYELLRKDFPHIAPVLIHLHKIIPTGAGLGGGSADAAFTLQILNTLGHLNLSNEKLMDYALMLGSDCPFFILNKPCYATGRGEQLVPIPVDLSAFKIMVVHPGLHVDTGMAFSGIQPACPPISLKETISKPVSHWKDKLNNDFEKVVFSIYPDIAGIKSKLYELGAVYASMSGSGSAVYGIFKKETVISYSFPAHYFVKTSIC